MSLFEGTPVLSTIIQDIILELREGDTSKDYSVEIRITEFGASVFILDGEGNEIEVDTGCGLSLEENLLLAHDSLMKGASDIPNGDEEIPF